ncbi:MAG: ribose-5-phosphate isomerase A, partial [Thermoplasmata archaeon]
PVPVEIHPFGWRNAAAALRGLGATVELRRRRGGDVFLTDNGNHIVDARFRSIPSPAKLAVRIMTIPGIVGHGLFLGMADAVIVASEKGVRTLRPKQPTRRP